jgi:hypothetical protein
MRLLQTINQGRLKDFQTALICHARSKSMLRRKHALLPATKKSALQRSFGR